MPKVYKTKFFNKWQRKSSELSDADLILAIDEMLKGLFEANLGGNLYKKGFLRQGLGSALVIELLLPVDLMMCGYLYMDLAKMN